MTQETDRDLLQQALDALVAATGYMSDKTSTGKEVVAAITALRTRLAQPEQPAQQEPVAWMLEWTFNGEERGYRLYDDERHCIVDAENDGGVCRPLYTHPAPQQPLTDEQIDREANSIFTDDPVKWWRELARAIEAAHGIGEQK